MCGADSHVLRLSWCDCNHSGELGNAELRGWPDGIGRDVTDPQNLTWVIPAEEGVERHNSQRPAVVVAGGDPIAPADVDALPADALVIAFPEHNGNVTAAYKNLFDWASRADKNVYQGKPMVIMAATPGPRAGAGVLGAVGHLAPFFGGEVRGSFGLGTFLESFDREKLFPVDPEKQAELRKALSALALETA